MKLQRRAIAAGQHQINNKLSRREKKKMKSVRANRNQPEYAYAEPENSILDRIEDRVEQISQFVATDPRLREGRRGRGRVCFQSRSLRKRSRIARSAAGAGAVRARGSAAEDEARRCRRTFGHPRSRRLCACPYRPRCPRTLAGRLRGWLGCGLLCGRGCTCDSASDGSSRRRHSAPCLATCDALRGVRRRENKRAGRRMRRGARLCNGLPLRSARAARRRRVAWWGTWRCAGRWHEAHW